MDTRILVPLDGSERAERAVPVAERVARNSGAGSHITLLQVVSRPAPLSGAYAPQVPPAPWMQQDVAAARAYLAHVAGWPLLADLSVETRVEIGGAPTAVILDVAEAEGSDLILICSHGRAGAAHWLLGSVAEQVARHASMPVLVLREQEAAPIGAREQPLRALVPLDGSSLGETVLAPAATLMLVLAELSQAVIHLVMVLPPSDADPAIVPEHPTLRSARIYLMRVADRLRAIYPRLEVGWSIVPGHDTARALLRVIETGGSAGPSAVSYGYDLIAMATHGRSGVAHWAFGSVTEHMLQHTHLPLLVVPPRAPDAKEAARRAKQPHAAMELAEPIHVAPGEAESLWTPLF